MNNYIVCLPDPIEDADLWGWDGPGWYFRDDGYWLEGPFATKEIALECYLSYLGREEVTNDK